MATEVVMPKLSPTMEEGQLSRWLKKEGDKVSMGEPIAEIDSDKATMEMQAFSNGVLRTILSQEGESAPLGQPIAIISEPDEDISALLEKAKSAAPPSSSAEAAEAKQTEVSPEAKKETEVPATPAPDGKQAGAVPAGGRMLVSPIAARMAAEAGINLGSLQGSGPAGRIVKRDIETAISGKKAAPKSAPALRAAALPRPGAKDEVYAPSAYRDEPLSEMRRTIARRLVTSLGPVPHFFIIKVTAVALLQHPQVNASFQDKTVRYYEHADIGVAVATENGLITPVVRSAELKSLLEIGAEVRELAERARARKLKPEEYTGASFSISNLGMFGIDEFTAVINPPEGAILAVGAMTPRPLVKNNEIVVRQMMRVTMSCDHRVIDGATGAKFLETLKKILENPLYLV